MGRRKTAAESWRRPCHAPALPLPAEGGHALSDPAPVCRPPRASPSCSHSREPARRMGSGSPHGPLCPQLCPKPALRPPAPHGRRPALPPFQKGSGQGRPPPAGPPAPALPRPRTEPRVHLPGAAVLQLRQDGHVDVFLRLLLGESLREKRDPGETPVTLPAPPLLSPDAQLGLLFPRRPSAQEPGPTLGPGGLSREPGKGVFLAFHEAWDVCASFRDPHPLPPHPHWASSGHGEAALLLGPQRAEAPAPRASSQRVPRWSGAGGPRSARWRE